MQVLMWILAVGVGAMVIAPLASAAGGLIGLGSLAFKSEFWFAAGTAVGAMVAYWVLKYWFGWLGVPYAWYDYILCMAMVVINDGNRAGRGESSMYATGTLMGMVASITTHLIL
jgi:hypothetical protein